MVTSVIGYQHKTCKVDYIEMKTDIAPHLLFNFNNMVKDLTEIFEYNDMKTIETTYKFFTLNHNFADIDYYYLYSNNSWYVLSRKAKLYFPKKLDEINDVNNMMDNLSLK
jgi:hypothetical protein